MTTGLTCHHDVSDAGIMKHGNNASGFWLQPVLHDDKSQEYQVWFYILPGDALHFHVIYTRQPFECQGQHTVALLGVFLKHQVQVCWHWNVR